MTDDTRKLLVDMRESAEEIKCLTSPLGLAAFAANKTIRAAVERHFLSIGEASNRIQKVDAQAFASSKDFKNAVSHRNFLIHAYDLVVPEKLWTTVTDSLPALLSHFEGLLR